MVQYLGFRILKFPLVYNIDIPPSKIQGTDQGISIVNHRCWGAPISGNPRMDITLW